MRVAEEETVFRDAQDLLFTHDGVPAGLVRAGEPRLRRPEPGDGPVLAVSRTRHRSPLRRLLRPAAS